MDHFNRLRSQIRSYLIMSLAGIVLASTISIWLLTELAGLSLVPTLAITLVLTMALGIILALTLTSLVLEPLKFLWEAILHVSPGHQGTAPPNLENARIGRELITSLVLQVYQMASHHDTKDEVQHRKEIIQATQIVSRLPLPLFVFNKQHLVTNASESALTYCHIESSQLFGKPLFDSLNLEFGSESTLEKWIEECEKDKITDHAYWERVRIRLPDEEDIRQCDLAAYYNRDNPSGTEFIVTLFDRTKQYNEDDTSLGFVALAVHELRTPLTVLRGYIEVFQEELQGKIDPELNDFLYKMDASAKQLNSFVNNILNVARVEENQLTLKLSEEKWESVLRQATHDIELLAQVHDITIQYNIATDLPTVAVDRISIFEVVNNLLDNAIKYSGESKKIYITSRVAKNGLVETLVQDFGVGISQSVVPTLFEKFHRNHRNSGRIAGTGLGLYLSKAIINAHGGQIWVESTEGKGSTFGFTLVPFSQLANEQKDGDNSGIIRTAHGWIKNHSLYRR